MKLSIRTKLAAAFGVALLFIAVTGAFSWSSTVKLVDNARMVDHTHEVLENLEDIVSQLKDAETGQRGFVITGEPHYLESYNAGLGGGCSCGRQGQIVDLRQPFSTAEA